jgi:transaldolase
MASLAELKIKLFADGADKESMLALYRAHVVTGFTTNPTLMSKAGVKDYRAFAHELLALIKDMPISFEVFSDDLAEMERQARDITTWAANVYVKIPITNTAGTSCVPLVRKLTTAGVKVNVTAMMLAEQVAEVCQALKGGAPSIVSVFAGRVADSGVNPMPIMKKCAALCRKVPTAELLWASTREIYNIFQAEDAGCKIITVPHDVLKKLPGIGKGLPELSLDTVKTFYKDATAAGFRL